MGKCWLHASSFIFDWIIIKVATRTSIKARTSWFRAGSDYSFWSYLPLKISHFWTWISVKPKLANLDQILCVASLGWGKGCIRFWGRLYQNSGLAHWTRVSDCCPLGYLLGNSPDSALWVRKVMSIPLKCFRYLKSMEFKTQAYLVT